MRSFIGSEYGDVGNFALVEKEAGIPSSGQIRIRVEASALGFVDGLLIQGRYQIRPPLPYVPGGEIAGVVDAVGPTVTGVSVGDRVVTWQLGGGLSEFVVVDAAEVEGIPAGLDAVAAAAMLVDYQTAHYALFERALLRSGETLLVLGASGGVGSAAVQLGAQAGAFVVGAASTEEKRELALRNGASGTIDYQSPQAREQIRAAAPTGLVDVVFDPVGGDSFEAMFRSLGKGGRHLVVGFAAGRIPSLPANLPLLKSSALVGVDIRHFLATSPEKARLVRASLFDQVASGKLRKPSVQVFSLEQAREAVAAASLRSKTGKVVVVP